MVGVDQRFDQRGAAMSVDDDLQVRLRDILESMLAEQGIELVELACRPHRGQHLVRLLIDKAGGVTIAQCARVNQMIGQALDAARAIEGSYTLEVSSPGLDRPLASQRDFARALGEELDVILSVEDGKTKELNGILLAVRDDAIVLKMTAGNVTIPLTQILVAKKAIHWS